MVTVWTKSAKLVPAHLPSKHSSTKAIESEGFHAPTPTQRLRVGRLELYTAIARTSLAANAHTTTLQWRIDVTAAELDQCIDEESGGFVLSSDAKFLNGADLIALAGRVGAGMCDLYMSSLGYIWRDQAAAVFSTRNALADFIYEGKPTAGAGVVLAEAKCTTQPRRSPSTQSLVDKAYLRQVEPYLGAVSTVGKVLHGYAIGLCAPIGKPAYVCAAETDAVLPGPGGPGDDTQASPTSVTDDQARASSSVRGTATVSVSTALGNYSTALALTGRMSAARALAHTRTGELSPSHAADILVKLIDTHSNGFVEGHVRGMFFPYSAIRFRIRVEPLAALANHLGSIEAGLDAAQHIDLPLMQTIASNEAGYAQFPDGLAGFSVSKDEAFEIEARLTLEERERYERVIQEFSSRTAIRDYGVKNQTIERFEHIKKMGYEEGSG